MEGKTVEEVNYRMIFINAAISAVATALTLGLLNKLFPSRGSGLGAPMKFIANLPLERQAQFADMVTISNINNEKWLKEQLTNIDVTNPATYKNFNRGSIGNCAFVALYAQDEQIRSKCLEILKNLKMYV